MSINFSASIQSLIEYTPALHNIRVHIFAYMDSLSAAPDTLDTSDTFDTSDTKVHVYLFWMSNNESLGSLLKHSASTSIQGMIHCTCPWRARLASCWLYYARNHRYNLYRQAPASPSRRRGHSCGFWRSRFFMPIALVKSALRNR